MKDTLVVEIKEYWTTEQSKLLGLLGNFSFYVRVT
jgi:hypothetical protein